MTAASFIVSFETLFSYAFYSQCYYRETDCYDSKAFEFVKHLVIC